MTIARRRPTAPATGQRAREITKLAPCNHPRSPRTNELNGCRLGRTPHGCTPGRAPTATYSGPLTAPAPATAWPTSTAPRQRVLTSASPAGLQHGLEAAEDQAQPPPAPIASKSPRHQRGLAGAPVTSWVTVDGAHAALAFTDLVREPGVPLRPRWTGPSACGTSGPTRWGGSTSITSPSTVTAGAHPGRSFPRSRGRRTARQAAGRSRPGRRSRTGRSTRAR